MAEDKVDHKRERGSGTNKSNDMRKQHTGPHPRGYDETTEAENSGGYSRKDRKWPNVNERPLSKRDKPIDHDPSVH